MTATLQSQLPPSPTTPTFLQLMQWISSPLALVDQETTKPVRVGVNIAPAKGGPKMILSQK